MNPYVTQRKQDQYAIGLDLRKAALELRLAAQALSVMRTSAGYGVL